MTISKPQLKRLCEIAGMIPPSFEDMWSQVGLIAAWWTRLNTGQRARVKAASHGLTGLVEHTICPTTGTAVGIYDKSSGLLDVSCPEARYAVICEEHSGLVMVESLRVARLTARDIRGVCEVCYDVPDKRETR